MTIDPRRTETARQSHLHLRPRPGTDVALAYGVAHYIIEHGLVDRDFVSRYTYGFDEFAREASRWTPERVERVTGVPRELVERFVEIYASRKPSVIFIGMGLSRSINGADAVRAVSLLPALVGIHRGFYYSNSRGWLINTRYLTGEELGGKPSRVVSMVELGELLEKGEFKFVYIYGVNAVESLSASEKVARGLARSDVFVVIHETRWTTTTRYADVILPAPTYLEKDDIPLTYGHSMITFSRRVVDPLGESKPEYRVMQELAKRLGVSEKWVYEDPLKALLKSLENALGEGSIDDLMNGRLVRLKQRRRDEYQTLTGKIEFYSLCALEMGLNPLPQLSQLEVVDDELLLLTSNHIKYTNSQFREVYGSKPPILHINPIDAEKRGIEEGDIVAVYNSYGEVHLRAVITNDVLPGTLWCPRHVIGLNGKPLNTIVPPVKQRVGGSPQFNGVRVKFRFVRKRNKNQSP